MTKSALTAFVIELIPVGLAVVAITALLLQVTIDLSETMTLGQSLLGFLEYGLPLAAVVAMVILIPVCLVWVISYAAMALLIRNARTRAIVASSLCAIIGNAMVIDWLSSLSNNEMSYILMLLPSALFSIFLSAVLTRSVFDRQGVEK